MNDSDTPPQLTEPAPHRTRWWFPVMFVVSAVAATIAIVAWAQRGGEDTQVTVPDLSALAGDGPTVEDPAPRFSVPLIGGGTFSLDEHLATDGRPVFLNLWASWCGPCRAEMPSIDAAATRHPDVLFLGVAVQDSADDAAAFAAEIGVTYPLAFDEGDVVGDGFGFLGLPATYLIGSDGGIVGQVFGIVTGDLIDQELETAFGG